MAEPWAMQRGKDSKEHRGEQAPARWRSRLLQRTRCGAWALPTRPVLRWNFRRVTHDLQVKTEFKMSIEKYYWTCQNGSQRFCVWRSGIVPGWGSVVYQDGKYYSKSIFLWEWASREGELDDAGEWGKNTAVHTPEALAPPELLRNAGSPPTPQTHQVRSCILTRSQVTHSHVKAW